MKMIYVLLIVLAAIGLGFAIFNKKKPNAANANVAPLPEGDTSAPGVTKTQYNVYDDMKRLAYSTEYSQLGLPDEHGKEVLYGVLMDWDYEGQAIITLVSFKTGDVSLYFSTGAAIIGAGQHPKVRDVSRAFVEKAQALLSEAKTTDTALVSEKGFLKFYLLTNKARYTIKDKMEHVNDHTSKLSGMFQEANMLIAYMRAAQEEMQQKNGK